MQDFTIWRVRGSFKAAATKILPLLFGILNSTVVSWLQQEMWYTRGTPVTIVAGLTQSPLCINRICLVRRSCYVAVGPRNSDKPKTLSGLGPRCPPRLPISPQDSYLKVNPCFCCNLAQLHNLLRSGTLAVRVYRGGAWGKSL